MQRKMKVWKNLHRRTNIQNIWKSALCG